MLLIFFLSASVNLESFGLWTYAADYYVSLFVCIFALSHLKCYASLFQWMHLNWRLSDELPIAFLAFTSRSLL